MLTFTRLISDPIPDHEQKQVALSYLHEAWAEAHLDGVDGDCMAQACLFRALSELIGTYGEDATAHFTEVALQSHQERRVLVRIRRQHVTARVLQTTPGFARERLEEAHRLALRRRHQASFPHHAMAAHDTYRPASRSR